MGHHLPHGALPALRTSAARWAAGVAHAVSAVGRGINHLFDRSDEAWVALKRSLSERPQSSDQPEPLREPKGVSIMASSTRTIDTAVAPDSTADRTRSGRRSPWPRRLAGLLLALASSIGLAAPAQAFIPPGPQTYWGTPEAIETSMMCRSGQIVLTPLVAVQRGYTNGQYAIYRYALWSSRGHRAATSGWSGYELQPYANVSFGSTYTYARTPLTTAYIPAPRGTYFEVAVQVGWYVPGYGYVYSSWRAADGYQSGFISPHPYSGPRSCMT